MSLSGMPKSNKGILWNVSCNKVGKNICDEVDMFSKSSIGFFKKSKQGYL